MNVFQRFSPTRNLFRVVMISFVLTGFLSCASAPSFNGFVAEVDSPHIDGFPLDLDTYAGEDINGFFPDAVYVKTRTQTFNSYHYYVLDGGLIWYKGITKKTGPSEWRLFKKTGLPYNDKVSRFHPARRIVEISADADELVALSDEGRFYRVVFDKNYSRKSNYWYDAQGWPTATQLTLNERVAPNLGWAIGKRNAHVRYYEDIFGNPHHYGTMEIATTYVLLKDGQEIRFGDTGLPSDFSHNLIGPERGRFIAKAISASASTMFVIGAAGEMYTRLADFDTIGCDPMFFKYTYQPYKSQIPGTDYRSNYESWGLPSEDWLKQPPILLRGKAEITKRITILQNGMGNSARELRVAGCDEFGQPGFWSKPIFGATWLFKRAPLYFSDDDFLKPSEYSSGVGPLGESQDIRMTGNLWKDDVIISDWKFEIPDFNILEGSCHLLIHYRGETAKIILYPVEAWTYFKRDSPGRDSTPKIYLLTMEIPDGAFDSLSPQTRSGLIDFIGNSDKKLFEYTLEATTNYIHIESQDRGKSGYSIFLTTNSDMRSYRPTAARVASMTDSETLERGDLKDLVIGSPEPFSPEDIPEFRDKITANEKLSRDIKQRLAALEESRRVAARSRFAYSAFSVVMHATLLYRLDFPKVYTLTRHAGTLMEENENQIELVSGIRSWKEGKLLDLIEMRIRAYSAVVSLLEKGATLAYFPPGFAENYEGYWKVAGLPKELNGRFASETEVERSKWGNMIKGISSRLKMDSVTSDMPGWFLEIGSAPSFSLFVELVGAPKTIYHHSGIPALRDPFELDARLHVIAAGSAESDRKLFERTLGSIDAVDDVPARVLWDGKALSIVGTTKSLKKKVLFRGLLPDKDS